MKENNYTYYASELQDVVSAYDLNKDSNLDINEFSSLLLSVTDLSLRNHFDRRLS